MVQLLLQNQQLLGVAKRATKPFCFPLGWQDGQEVAMRLTVLTLTLLAVLLVGFVTAFAGDIPGSLIPELCTKRPL
jgi:hypothetical protein